MSADSRSIQTDALSVLGNIIDRTVGRDAIHLAVEPVIAGRGFHPGSRIILDDDGVTAIPAPPGSKGLGIVDPFLPQPVQQGQRFLMLLNPGQIATLRHVWDHPAFTPSQTVIEKEVGGEKDTQTWLKAFAAEVDIKYPDFLRDMFKWSSWDEEPWWWGSDYDDRYDELWTKMGDLFGTDLDRGNIDFSCRGCD